jgi:hypothetical protein
MRFRKISDGADARSASGVIDPGVEPTEETNGPGPRESEPSAVLIRSTNASAFTTRPGSTIHKNPDVLKLLARCGFATE